LVATAFCFMGKITALTRQKRNSERVNVYLDDEFAFGLAALTAVHLRVGQTLSEPEIEALKEADTVEKAKEAAIRLIEYRPRSSGEIRRKLRQKAYSDTVIEHVIERLTDVQLLDDAAFARYWVEQRETFKPRSQMALRQELRQKGVQRDVIDKAVSEVDELAAAQKAAEKQARRYMKLPEDAFKKKLGGFLRRRGFNYDIIRQVTDEIWENYSSDLPHYTNS